MGALTTYPSKLSLISLHSCRSKRNTRRRYQTFTSAIAPDSVSSRTQAFETSRHVDAVSLSARLTISTLIHVCRPPSQTITGPGAASEPALIFVKNFQARTPFPFPFFLFSPLPSRPLFSPLFLSLRSSWTLNVDLYSPLKISPP